MKTIIGIVLLLASVGFYRGAAHQEHPKPEPCTFAVSGMTCEGCSSAVQSAISGTKGCMDAAVNLTDGLARFKIDACCVPLQELIKAVEKHGQFKAALVLQVTPSQNIEKTKIRETLLNVKGVKTVTGPDDKGLIKVTFKPNQKTFLTELVKAGKEKGITLRDPKPAE